MNRCYIDFETRSEADLRTVGAALYSEHPSTDVLCVGYSFRNGDRFSTVLLNNAELKSETAVLRTISSIDDYIFTSHNAIFEQFIWKNVMVKKYGYPEIPVERWRCTLSKALSHGLPGSLEDCAEILQLPIKKDMEGRDNMLSLSKPIPERKVTYPNAKKLAKKYGLNLSEVKPKNWEQYCNRKDILDLFKIVDFWTPEEQPEKFQKLYEYCSTDVEVCKAIDEKLPDLIESEQKLWFLDQKLNQTGVRVDRPTVSKIVHLLGEHEAALLKEFSALTNGEIESPRQRTKLLEYLNANGISVENTQKQTIAVLTHESESVSRVLEITKELSKSSVAKYQSMLDRSDEVGRVREITQYHAAHTGRFGGRGIQLQNLPRQASNIDLDDIHNLEYPQLIQKYHNLTDSFSTALRSMLIPSPGNIFYIGDYAQMEARVLAWLAGEYSILEVFISGKDPYCTEASNIFGYEVTKSMKMERQVGKVAVLALGYGGGIGAFAKMAKDLNVDLSPLQEKVLDTADTDETDRAQRAYEFYLQRKQDEENLLPEDDAIVVDVIKQRWRAKNINIVKFWVDLEKTVKSIVKTGVPVKVGPLTWFYYAPFLVCKLPSGRSMVYPYPVLGFDGSLTYYSNKGRVDTYGGKLSENITQAVQRDLLADALLNLDESGLTPKFHVHDEIVCESKDDSKLQMFKEIMQKCPAWCQGLPIDVDVKIAKRYEK